MPNKIFIFTIIFTAFIWAQTGFAEIDTGNQEGRFIGKLTLESGETLTKHGEWWYDEIYVKAGATLYVTAYDGDDAKGKIILRANKIQVDGTIDAKNRGDRGVECLGGEGGISGNAVEESDGEDGGNAEDAKAGFDGEGPFGGDSGGGGTAGGNGGKGGDNNYPGFIGGIGGLGGNSSDFRHGQNGGYLNSGINGDMSIYTSLFIGSAGGSGGSGAGGGGGGGGGSGVYCWYGDGGNGGKGGKGGKGGNGGGYIKIFANNSIHIKGFLTSEGEAGIPGQQGETGEDGKDGCYQWGGRGGSGGVAQENGEDGQLPVMNDSAGGGGGGGGGGNGSNGGNGAGGGILLYCSEDNDINITGNIDARGGGESSINGGTVKIFFRETHPSLINIKSGRLFIVQSHRKATIPELTTPANAFTTYQDANDLRAVYQSPDLYKGRIYFQVATDNTFNNIVFDALSANLVASGTEVKITTSELSPGSYYWRAQNVDSLGLGSDYSEMRSFVVLYGVPPTPSPISTVTPTSTPIPTSASDIQIRVFPSRINPEKGEYASIRWCQDESCPATIKLYNLHGELVKTLADNIFYPRGREHEVSWRGVNTSGKTVGSGIYIVHIQAGGYQDKVKICVVK